jgi:purine-binding chemotaxis protein CheW
MAKHEQTQHLTFQLAGEEYAVGILKVKEIIEFGTLTVVPNTPPSVRGVINLRGNVVPVVDLAVKFGMAPSPITHRTCIVIVEVTLDAAPVTMGVIADSVSQVVDLAASDILAPPAFGTRIKADFLQGMAKADKKFLLILDIDKVVSADEVSGARAATQPQMATRADQEPTRDHF